ncbi:MAG: L-iditol 2-dehydrogenase [Bauldia sp.]|uniref:L-iditol 2-dehydrogenase n=1 Tax=Bauldia sp. TaxID=2575872 RepID=UPI001DDCEDED|nr:L-iditol 2-dehydrogenase [Bauldia sp.]MCB1495634.1 L-iditol 2-dehydrogenase [Bauldia sp.]
MRLKDKVALVTGGARGIGRAICERYVAEGARVVVADLLADEAQETAKAIGERASAVSVDVSRLSSIQEMGEAVMDSVGAPDILVNGAAVFGMAPLAEISEDHFDRQFDINVRGLLFTTQVIAAQMIAAGKRGKIINFSSQAGRRGEANVAIYCATKAAVISITQSCALELIKSGINVNAIAPGVVDTPMWDVVDSLFAKYENRPIGEKKRLVGEAVPFGRMGTPEDMAGAAVFLASADADYIVAQTLNVDGGNWMS